MIKATLGIIPHTTTEPSSDRSEEFWNNFASSVETRIRQTELAGARRRSSMWGVIQPWFVLHRPHVATASGVVAVLILGFIGWRLLFPLETEAVKPQIADREVVADTTSERISLYFRRSKVLLVGITNMKTSFEGHPVDLGVEREASRQLVREARLLQSEHLDPQATRLIRNLEKIQIELANMNQEVPLPNIEMIRSGIHRENLLFKTRMAESAYESVQFVRVNEKY
jgi:hypothetical protein